MKRLLIELIFTFHLSTRLFNMSRSPIIYIFLVALFWKLQISVCQEVIVHIKQGQIRGNETYTDSGVKYFRFVGIPYAKPPVGALRFKAPQPADSWEGIRDAQELGSSCEEDEDCLFINVMTPKLPSGEPLLHTIVYIHGGAFSMGNGGFYANLADSYLENDIVFVTMNYRLGPFGFLSTGDSVVPGNNGLKDQNLALQWVQQNIVPFGGDPNSVIICGCSAGGASVHYQVLSPMSKGLFHGAIAQSGSALNPWAFEDTSSARSRTLRYGQAMGVNTNDSQALIAYLRTKSFKELLDGVDNAMTELEKTHAISFFAPTNEPSESGEVIFLQEHPLNIMIQGSFNHVPFLTGTVSQEGMILVGEVLQNPEKLEYFNNNFELILPENLIVEKNVTQQIVEKVKYFYLGDKNLTQETLIQYINFFGDTQFVNGVNHHSWLHGLVSTAPVYQYFFKYAGRLGILQRFLGDYFPGVAHSDEEGYIFNYYLPYDGKSDLDNEISKRMIALWTNFVKTRNPTPQPEPLLQNVTWSPVSEFDHFYLEIGNDLIISRNLLNDRMTFWNDIYSSISGYHK